MKITAFNGSPKGNKGNTHVIVEEFLKGAKDAGAEVENILLAKKKINHCLGCLYCWFKKPGECVIKDDMAELLGKFIASDVVIFATPLYADNVSGITKNFTDRLIPFIDPRFAKDEQGECRHLKRYDKIPKVIVISNCGFSELSQFQVLKLLFKRLSRNMSSEVVAEIYRTQGPLLTTKNILLKPFIAAYKKSLKNAGKEFVTESKISEKTMEKLEKNLIPEERYIKETTKYFESLLDKIEKENE